MATENTTLTRYQRLVLANPDVKLLGWDAKSRPVVEGQVGIPKRLQQWALLKSGDPTDITEPVTYLP